MRWRAPKVCFRKLPYHWNRATTVGATYVAVLTPVASSPTGAERIPPAYKDVLDAGSARHNTLTDLPTRYISMPIIASIPMGVSTPSPWWDAESLMLPVDQIARHPPGAPPLAHHPLTTGHW